ncbi:MAG TPA: efflux RND transporter periplasmic adaptor subunit [Myxococcota bacterium]|jgi:HlyD family secretion protein
MNDSLALPKKKVPWALVVIAIVAVGAAAFFFIPKAPEKPRTTTAALDRGDVVVRVTATGTLSALVTVQVGSQVSARISEIDADFNSPVKKGQVIARLDRQLLDAAVTEAKANNAAASAAIDRAKVQAANAAVQRDRARELASKKLISQTDLDTAELAAKVAEADLGTTQAQLEQSKSELERAQINLSYATIYSPIDGVVISRAVDVGQTVAASLSAPTLFTIAQDLKHMQVDTSVGEADIGKITAGMDASFTVDAFPGEKFTGHVRQIRNAATTVSNVVTYDVIIDVDNPELRLRPGMTANASFTVATKENALRIPNAALRFKAPKSFAGGGDKKRDTGAGQRPKDAPPKDHEATREVWVMRADKPASTMIRTGLSDGSFTEVVSGDLKEGDDVVTDAVDASAKDGPPGGGGMPRGRPF